MPNMPGSAQASHCPSQAVSQHTPSAHAPLSHSRPSRQSAASGFFGAQVPPTMQYPSVASQEASSAQVVPQMLPTHGYGAQATVSSLHWPAPSHTWPLTSLSLHAVAPQGLPFFAYG